MQNAKVAGHLKAAISGPPDQRSEHIARAEEAIQSATRGGHAMRIDIHLTASNGSEAWVDNTTIHPTAASRRKENLRWHLARQLKETQLQGLVPEVEQSPGMLKAVKAKHDKYVCSTASPGDGPGTQTAATTHSTLLRGSYVPQR